MAQFLRPASDVSDGAWLPSTGADLYATIDESSASDSDYNYTESESAFEVALSTGTDPSLSTGHIVRYRAAGDGALDLVVTLKQGATPIATWTESAASASFTDYSHTLSGGEADAITDYTALSLHFDVAAGGPVELASDNFTRGDNTDFGTNWDESTGGSLDAAGWQIVSNTARTQVDGIDTSETWNAVSFPNDQYVQCTFGATAADGVGSGLGLCGRSTSGATSPTMYRVVGNASGYEFGRMNGGTFTSLSSGSGTTFAATNTLRMELLTSGADCAWTLKKNGSTFASGTDTSPVASGRAGVFESSFTTETTNTLTAWSAGSL